MLNESFQSYKDSDFLAIAHRGASAYAPENTMAAFKLAYKMEADMIELDVQLSKDEVPVVFHDAKLDHHSNGEGLVSSFLLEELQLLDAGKWYSVEFQGEKIPSLEEVLIWASGKIQVNIEIKKESVSDVIEDGVEEKVVKLVRQIGMEKDVIISSFDYRAIKRIKQLSPQLLTGLLYHKEISSGRNPVELLNLYKADFFHCSKSEMKKRWIALLRESGQRYLIYTVNQKSGMKKWINKGAFGIFSDKPDTLKAISNDYF